MSNFKLEIVGSKGRVDLSRMSRRFERAIAAGGVNRIMDELVIAANNIRNEMITSMKNSPPIGKKYTGGRTAPHIASGPGKPPRVDSGQLINSLVMDERLFEVEVGSNITEGEPPYPVVLEFGRKDGSMEARPWMAPAFEVEKDNIKKALIRAVDDTLRGAVG